MEQTQFFLKVPENHHVVLNVLLGTDTRHEVEHCACRKQAFF